MTWRGFTSSSSSSYPHPAVFLRKEGEGDLEGAIRIKGGLKTKEQKKTNLFVIGERKKA